MQPAVLLPQAHEPDEPAITERPLNVAVSEQVPDQAVWVRESLRGQWLLTSVHMHHLERDFVTTVLKQPRVEPDNPFLSEKERRRLDPDGLVPEGTILGPDDVLISAVFVESAGEGEQQPRSERERLRDDSERVPEGWAGARVVAVRRQGQRRPGRAAKEPEEHIEITLRAERDVAIGDVLLVGQTPLGVVAHFLSDTEAAADVMVSRSVGKRLRLRTEESRDFAVSKAAEGGADVLQARSTGLYSLITCTPQKRGRRGGQDVSESQVRWLRSRGLFANVTELVCLKSDDLRNRGRLQQLSPGLPPAQGWSVPAAPDSQFIFRTLLLALGLNVQMTSAGDHIDLTLRPATTEELLTHSRGPIVCPETINYRTYAPVQGGLFCENVYGPEESPGRRRRFGHIKLPEPIVPLLWRTGSPSPLERLLGLPAEEMEKIVQYKAPGPSGGIGATAIRALLEQLSPASLPPGLRGRAAALVQDTLLVPPPDLRPLVLLDNGNFATSDLNDLYRRVINRVNRLRKLVELHAPETILENERRQLQGTVDALQANCLLSRPVNGSNDRPLVDCLRMVVSRALESTTKRVDYSARARPVVAASLPEDRVAVPQRIFTTLGLHPDSPVLLTNPADREGTWLALLPQPHDEVVLGLPPAAFQRLRYRPTATNPDILCQLHRPLGPKACTEARALFRHDPGEVCPVPSKTGWTDGEDEEAILSGLREAILTGEAVPLNSARGLMLAGTGVVEDGDEAAITHFFDSSYGA
jgi:hypothetical protein